MWQQQLSGILAGGSPRSADVGEPLWMAKVITTRLTRAEARVVDARINALRGALNSFYLWNPAGQYPLADPRGLILGAAVVTVSAFTSTTVTFAGLPAGYQLSIGDFWSLDYTGPRRIFHQLTSVGVADGSGVTGAISVTPPIDVANPVGMAVTLKRPAMEAIIMPGSYEGVRYGPTNASLSFQALQV
jgi:hypothetical protein